VNPLLCYVRERLRRRLFVWFGATIVLTAVTVVFVFVHTGGEDSRVHDIHRLQAFAGGRFERVWDTPAEREELARALSRDLAMSVTLAGADGAALGSYGDPCSHASMHVPVMREGLPLGEVRVCADRFRPQPWRWVLAIFVTMTFLWAGASRIAGRISRPMAELARVAGELGAGNFTARVRIPRRHHFGEAAALAATMNDMAARVQRHLAEQRELLAAVSHEMRTPLARIRLLTEMARGQGASDKTLDDLDREVMEMDALVGDLLASSRMDFAALSKRPLDAVETASRALERAGADPASLVVEREGEGEARGPELRVDADATLLGRALANLLDNANKHGGGVEALRVKRMNGHVHFEVEDHGDGFGAGEEARIFEPFYRRGENGSLGLGLALVKRIAEAHGGRAYAENREGGGARVGVELPAPA
jgi:two-component system, OmpR family, sensor kinase